ncbi:ribbon-helix-helix protein, CopG family [Rhodococcus sp. WS1]|nr:ribbon-helix-helix protein, CopG family [Rhodococcus sp. WS1]
MQITFSAVLGRDRGGVAPCAIAFSVHVPIPELIRFACRPIRNCAPETFRLGIQRWFVNYCVQSLLRVYVNRVQFASDSLTRRVGQRKKGVAFMPPITIRIDDESKNELDVLAKSSEQTVSDLVRGLIDQKLGRGARFREGDSPSSLAPTERLMLAQQLEILAALAKDQDDKTLHLQRAEVLRRGYAGEYSRVFADLDEELEIAECRRVWDILDMFRVLGASVDVLTEADLDRLGDRVSYTRFAGFDLADPVEGRMLGYVRHLAETERWTEIEKRLEEIGDDGNSHSRRLPGYDRMVEVFKPIWSEVIRNGPGDDGYVLTATQVYEVVGAL